MVDVKHTPTPLIIDQGYIFDADNNIVGKIYDRCYAAHIVKCVNMHDELVRVIRGLLDAYSRPDVRLCCNGHLCGCRGYSSREQAEYFADETLKKAGAI